LDFDIYFFAKKALWGEKTTITFAYHIGLKSFYMKKYLHEKLHPISTTFWKIIRILKFKRENCLFSLLEFWNFKIFGICFDIFRFFGFFINVLGFFNFWRFFIFYFFVILGIMLRILGFFEFSNFYHTQTHKYSYTYTQTHIHTLTHIRLIRIKRVIVSIRYNECMGGSCK
jgi:hypothetical protein